jgi:hypothetical protein
MGYGLWAIGYRKNVADGVARNSDLSPIAYSP